MITRERPAGYGWRGAFDEVGLPKRAAAIYGLGGKRTLGVVALQIAVASCPPTGCPPGPGWQTLLLPVLIGAATALAAQLMIQLYVVPKVETRKRREDRWERNVIELGDLLTTELRKCANEAQVEQGKFRDLRQLESEPGLDQDKIAQSREQQVWAAHHSASLLVIAQVSHSIDYSSDTRSGRYAGSGLARTLSVDFRDFTRPDPRAHGHMTDRQDHQAGH